MNLAESLTLSHQIFEGSHPPRQISIFCTQNKNLCMPQNKKKIVYSVFPEMFQFLNKEYLGIASLSSQLWIQIRLMWVCNALQSL